jgi:hypothetical protein
MPLSDDTLLVLSGVGVPRYSARGLSQTLEPIDASSQIHRTIDGGMRDLSLPQFRKYRSTLTARDQRPPSVDGKWPGQVVTVDCVQELSCLAAGVPARTVVPGSDHVEEGFKFYRPRLVMMVIKFSMGLDEWGADQSWSMDLEEV